MIVVAIIGILSSLAAFVLGNKVDDAKINKAKADIQAVNSALELYYIDNGEYPQVSSYESLETYLVGEYLKELPQVPDEKYEYEYKYDSETDKAEVYCPQIEDESKNSSGGS